MNQTANNYQGVIVQQPLHDGKIYLREQKGFYQRIRRYLSSFLMLIFVGLPFIQWHGKQAILIDITQQKIYFFSQTLYPQDLLIVGAVFVLAAFLLFYVTRLYGRVWCGYTCPQTIWMLMFNWIERRVEGSHRHSKALDQLPLSVGKVLKKSVKHFLWLFIALMTSLVFISYFVPARSLYQDFFTFNSTLLVQSWVYFFMLCTYVNAGWIKDKMCLHMCPYSRFQSVMFQADTKLVTYDEKRGENRGPRKRNTEKPVGKGDCVDCGLCVEVCPVGIDIRDGLQYECINCGLCADACNDVMAKFNYKKNLIHYQWQTSPKAPWKRHITYGLLCLLSVVGLWLLVVKRSNVEVNILRDRQALYRINTEGQSENSYTFKIINKTQTAKTYSLAIQSPQTLLIKGETYFSIGGGEQFVQPLSVAAIEYIAQPHVPVVFTLLEHESQMSTEHISTFYRGKSAW